MNNELEQLVAEKIRMDLEKATELLEISFHNCVHLAEIIEHLIEKYKLDKPATTDN